MHTFFKSAFFYLINITCLFSLNIIEDSNNITIITGGYNAIIARNTGMVESLKLNGSDFELISDVPNYSLFFVEYIYEYPNGVDSYFSYPAINGDKITIDIVHQNSQTAFIRVQFNPGHINSEWYYLFEEGKQWFSTTITRKVVTAGVYSNFQQCTMYNPDVDNSFIINYEGDIELTMGSYDGMYSIVSPFLDGVNYSTRTAQHSLWTQFDYGIGRFYPTIAWSDNESGICMGAIVTHTSPNQRESISYHGGGTTGQHPGFAEAQWNWFGKSDSESMYLKEGLEFSMNLIFYQNISHIDSLFYFVESLKSDHYEWVESENYSIASWGGRSSPMEHYYWRFPQVSNNTINSQELWRHKGFAVPRSQIGTHDSQLFSLDIFYETESEIINVSPIYGLSPLFTSIENIFTDTSSTGIMHWNESGIESELSFTAFKNKNSINVSGVIEKQNNGYYYIKLDLSPRNSGYQYYPSKKLINIYSLDPLLDTTAISLHFLLGIDSVELSNPEKITLYLNSDTPEFSIDLLSSTGYTIYNLSEWMMESLNPITEYRESYVQCEEKKVAVRPSSDFIITQVDSTLMRLFVCNNFSNLYFTTKNKFSSAIIQNLENQFPLPIMNIDDEIQNIHFQFRKNEIYNIRLSHKKPQELTEKSFTILNQFPNPVIDMMNVDLLMYESGKIKYRVFNLLGEEFNSGYKELQAGFNSLNINVSQFPSSIYFIRFESQKTISTLKFHIIH